MSKLSHNATKNLLKELNDHGTHHTTTHSKLDTIATNTANIKLSTDSVNLNVDTLEALQQTTINHLDGVIGHINNTNAIGSGQNALKSMSLGYDRINDKGVAILVDSAGHVQTDIVSTALPTGGATSALQADIESSLNSLISANHTDLEHVSSDLDTANGHLNTIDGKITACNTGAVVVSSSGLPSGASTSALQGDIESSLNSLISANHTDLEHISDNLDTLETTLTEIATDGNNIQTKLDTIDGSINTIEACVGSNKVNVNISSGSMSLASGASTEAKQDDMESSLNSLISANHTDLEHISDNLDTLETTLTEIAVDGNNIQTKLDTIDGSINTIEACVGSSKVNVNISSGNISGFATSALQGDIESSLNSLITANHTDFGTLDTTTQGVADAVDNVNAKITACNTGAVVISSGAITATLSATDNAVLDTIDAVLDTIKVDTEAIETAVEKLSGVSEAVWINNATINAQALGASLDTTGYTKVRLYGLVNQSFVSGASDLVIMGSLTSGGTYFHLGQAVSQEIGTSADTFGITFNCVIESPPKFIKIWNISGSDNYTMTINAKMTHT